MSQVKLPSLDWPTWHWYRSNKHQFNHLWHCVHKTVYLQTLIFAMESTLQLCSSHDVELWNYSSNSQVSLKLYWCPWVTALFKPMAWSFELAIWDEHNWGAYYYWCYLLSEVAGKRVLAWNKIHIMSSDATYSLVILEVGVDKAHSDEIHRKLGSEETENSSSSLWSLKIPKETCV